MLICVLAYFAYICAPHFADDRALSLYCDVKGWQYKSSVEFKHIEFVILLQVLEPSRRAQWSKHSCFL